MRSPLTLLSWILFVVAGGSGCSEMYCQSGPKYGTQCYSTSDIDLQLQNSRGDAPPMRGPTTSSCSRTTLPDGTVLESADCVTLRHQLEQR